MKYKVCYVVPATWAVLMHRPARFVQPLGRKIRWDFVKPRSMLRSPISQDARDKKGSDLYRVACLTCRPSHGCTVWSKAVASSKVNQNAQLPDNQPSP